jgi:hypothetical protein
MKPGQQDSAKIPTSFGKSVHPSSIFASIGVAIAFFLSVGIKTSVADQELIKNSDFSLFTQQSFKSSDPAPVFKLAYLPTDWTVTASGAYAGQATWIGESYPPGRISSAVSNLYFASTQGFSEMTLTPTLVKPFTLGELSAFSLDASIEAGTEITLTLEFQSGSDISIHDFPQQSIPDRPQAAGPWFQYDLLTAAAGIDPSSLISGITISVSSTDLSAHGFQGIDNVSILQAVPEPSVGYLLTIGLFLLSGKVIRAKPRKV